ncbi:MAG: hydrolase [Planctomycetota bacterium]|nr:MAG: hydrolase [Planctomycetota bacterium]
MIQPETSALMVVDVQEKLIPAIHQSDACVEMMCRMIEAAKVLGVPMIVTEQYPRGIGPTIDAIRKAVGDIEAIEKVRFSGCIESVIDQLREVARPYIVIVGVETHVCVQQTVLDLLRLGYTPYVCADAVGSRRPFDRDIALERMRQAGAVITTTESVTFELLGQAATDTFRKVLKIVK